MKNGFRLDRESGLLLLLLLGLKLSLLVLDHDVRFFLGDSQTFVVNAVMGTASNHRSFFYSFLIRWLGSLDMLLLMQTVGGAFAAFLLGICLRIGLGVRAFVAWAAAIAFAVAPLQLAFERFVMSEALSMLCFASFVTCQVLYLRRRTPFWLVISQVFGICAIAFRVTFLPVIVLMTAGILVWAVLDSGLSRRQRGVELLATTVALVLLHGGYTRLYGTLTGNPPDYQYAKGLFMLAAWSPLLASDDFPDREVGRLVIAESGPLSYDRRNDQMWGEHGLRSNLLGLTGNQERAADALASRVVRTIALSDPGGIAVFALRNYGAYFSLDGLRRALRTDLGLDRALPPSLIKFLGRLYGLQIDGRSQMSRGAVIDTYALGMLPWYCILSVGPLLSLLCAWRHRRNPIRLASALLVALGSAGLMAVTILFSAMLVVRYLQPFEWLSLFSLALLAERPTPAVATRQVGGYQPEGMSAWHRLKLICWGRVPA